MVPASAGAWDQVMALIKDAGQRVLAGVYPEATTDATQVWRVSDRGPLYTVVVCVPITFITVAFAEYQCTAITRDDSPAVCYSSLPTRIWTEVVWQDRRQRMAECQIPHYDPVAPSDVWDAMWRIYDARSSSSSAPGAGGGAGVDDDAAAAAPVDTAVPDGAA